jgi:hypothetical protein
MALPDRRVCPYCTRLVPLTSIKCDFCGKDLQADLYMIVPDGKVFGIALRGEVLIHGLALKMAQDIASILNGNEERQPPH